MAKTTADAPAPEIAPVTGDRPVDPQTGAAAPPVVDLTPEATPVVEAVPVEVPTDDSPTFTPEVLEADADGDGIPDDEDDDDNTPKGEVIETWPAPFRPESEYTISVQALETAAFYGQQTTEPYPGGQVAVEALEDFLRSHAVGGSTRTSEGYYGSKTRALVNAAYRHYLPDLPREARNGLVSSQLAAALKAAGAPIGA